MRARGKTSPRVAKFLPYPTALSLDESKEREHRITTFSVDETSN